MKKPLMLLLSLIPWHVWADDQTIEAIFKKYEATGTIVIQSYKDGTTYVWNTERSEKRFASASTFKIFNTLIAIDEGVFDPESTQFIWDGTMHEFPDWNRNMSLAMAYKASCVWCYQTLAEQIGAAKYLHHIRRAQYGEIAIPFQGTTFWLDGSFKVSAVEQIRFLRKLYQRDLPYSESSYDALESIMQANSPPAYRFYAKTGWARRVNPEIGWYVGYVVTSSDVWFFAMNTNIQTPLNLPLRQKITLEALQVKGIIP